MATRVATPDGIEWTVRRRWMPHRKVRWRRLRRHPDQGLVADTGPRRMSRTLLKFGDGPICCYAMS
jgi:hypothetical protein